MSAVNFLKERSGYAGEAAKMGKTWHYDAPLMTALAFCVHPAALIEFVRGILDDCVLTTQHNHKHAITQGPNPPATEQKISQLVDFLLGLLLSQPATAAKNTRNRNPLSRDLVKLYSSASQAV